MAPRATRRSGTSTSSSRPCPSASRSSTPSSPSSTRSPRGHAILASNTSSLSITEIGGGDQRPDKVVGFHYFYPGLDHAADRDRRRRRHLGRDVGAAVNFAQAIRKQPITCAEVPGFVVNRILNAGISEVWREQEEKGLSIKASTRASAPPTSCRWALRPGQPARPGHVLHVAEHLHESYGDRFYVPTGLQRLVAEGKLGAKTAATASTRRRASPRSTATPSPTSTTSSSC
jgi:hypothetical protein